MVIKNYKNKLSDGGGGDAGGREHTMANMAITV